MGWDIVAIGLKHNLPIDNPFEIAEKFAPLFEKPIEVGYYVEWEYDIRHNLIYTSESFNWKVLRTINSEKNGKPIKMEIVGKCAKIIYERLDKKVSRINFKDQDDYDCFLAPIFNPYCLYDFDSPDEYIGLRVFTEIVEFDQNINLRWFRFQDLFREPYQKVKNVIDPLRDYINRQSEIAGCSQIFYFPDQGYGERLMDEMNQPSDVWINYLNSRECYKTSDMEDSISDPIFNIKDYVEGKIILKPHSAVYCFYDEAKNS